MYWRIRSGKRRQAAKEAYELDHPLPDRFQVDKRFNPKFVSRHGVGYAIGMTGHNHNFDSVAGQRVATLLARTNLPPLTDWTVTAPATLVSPSGDTIDLNTVFEIAVDRLRSIFTA